MAYLIQGTPNPFNPASHASTTITLAIPTSTDGPFLEGMLEARGFQAGSGTGAWSDTVTYGADMTTFNAHNVGNFNESQSLSQAALNALNSTMGGNITVTFYNAGATAMTGVTLNLVLRTKSDKFTATPSPGNGGDPGGNGLSGLWTNPYTLTGTKITDISTDALAMSARVHSKSSNHYQYGEIWYLRDGSWSLVPNVDMSKDFGPKLTTPYRAPATLDFDIAQDPNGWFTPENVESAYNYNNDGAEDALLDEARPIIFRMGIVCYSNLASGLTPTLSSSDGSATVTGALNQLCDGVVSNYYTSPLNNVVITPVTSTYVDLIVDLGSSQLVQHVAIRLGTKNATLTLPYQLEVLSSLNGTAYASIDVRPIGGASSTTLPPGDWDENYDGAAVLITMCDMSATARYIKFRLTCPNSGAISVDELAIYGGNTVNYLGRNFFYGYLGDNIQVRTTGRISLTATSAEKKLGDNNDARLTAAFKQNTSGAIELADIAYTLMNSSAYWVGPAGSYSGPVPASQIGWRSGQLYTAFNFPMWQGQGNSILGYLYELFNTIGWWFYADGNGIYQAKEPSYSQTAPDRVLSSGPHSDRDVYELTRTRTGHDLRNKVQVTSGKATQTGTGLVIAFNPGSAAKYGFRTSIITDPVAITLAIRQKIASYFLRDYAWRLSKLTMKFKPDMDTGLRQIIGIRAPNRPSMYAKACALVGKRRKRELWYISALTQYFSTGHWYAEATCLPYNPQTTQPPSFNSIVPGVASGGLSVVTLNWSIVSDPKAVSIKVYISTVGENGPFVLDDTIGASAITQSYSLTTGTTYWFYLTTVDTFGQESMPSQVLSVVPGTQGLGNVDFQVTDLAIGLALVSGPDALGTYTYQLYGTWTSPSNGGFKQMWLKGDLRNPASGAYNQYDVNGGWQFVIANWWNTQQIPPGKTWDRATAGQLDGNWHLRTSASLSGQTLYLRMFTSTKTTTFTNPGVSSNLVTVTIP